MLIRIGCLFDYQASAPTPMIVLVGARHEDPRAILQEDRLILPAIDVHEYLDGFGNRCWRLLLPEGPFRVGYDALVEVSSDPDPSLLDATQTPVQDLPDDTLSFTLPSRHCQSDLLMDTAWELFGGTAPGWGRVQAICDWVHQNIAYKKGSIYTTSALDVYHARAGVCRDFAHLGVTFCRALNIPARYIFGYLPDAGIVAPDEPMDFHAWFEAFVDGQWRTFDARHNKPRLGRVPVGRGRDAVDVAMSTSYGSVRLQRMQVWADEVDTGNVALSGLSVGKTLPVRRWEAEVLV